ncbi:MAG: FHA domain-containing protein [Rhodanobacteraceae bacterium]|nr:FHA domain-containing protein [Rhodanobacteraceae bacterium]
MPALLTLHPPSQPVLQCVLNEDAGVLLGRASDCDIVLSHDSVSRQHARIVYQAGQGWVVTDLGSKNGVRIDGKRSDTALLRGTDWFAIGDVFCQLRQLDEASATALGRQSVRKRESSSAWTRRLDQETDAETLLRTTLAGIVELADCRRGFLLAAGSAGRLEVRVCTALQPEALSGRAFLGSRSAISRAMQDRRAVFLSDQPECAWLRDQASVVAHGIRALVALPLIHDGLLLGVAYADSDETAKHFTALDAELLEAFADRAAMALAAADLEAALKRMESWLSLDESSAPAATRPPLSWAAIDRTSRP